MALETLKNVEKINGFRICHDGNGIETDEGMDAYLHINHDDNTIQFTIQNGPIKENGCNGCQVDQLIDIAAMIIYRLNEKHPDTENEMAIYHLHQSLNRLSNRRRKREYRNVEGTNQT